MGITRRSLFPLAAGALAWAQEEADFSIGINVVNVLASVRDKQGRFLNDLPKEDFVLEENGRPQPLRYFSTQSDQPLTLGFLIDVSGSEMSFIPEERRASYRFIDKVLREDRDKSFIMRFYQRVELLKYLTSSRTELETALNRVEEPPPQEAGKSVQQGRMFLGTALYDAVFIASDAVMRKQQGAQGDYPHERWRRYRQQHSTRLRHRSGATRGHPDLHSRVLRAAGGWRRQIRSRRGLRSRWWSDWIGRNAAPGARDGWSLLRRDRVRSVPGLDFQPDRTGTT